MSLPGTVVWILLPAAAVVRAQGPGQPSAEATAHIGKGSELVQDDRFAEAAQEFRAALALDPETLNARAANWQCACLPWVSMSSRANRSTASVSKRKTIRPWQIVSRASISWPAITPPRSVASPPSWLIRHSPILPSI
jgi:hypothetical protein